MKGIARVSVLGLVSVLLLGVVCLWSDCTTKGASTIIVPDDYSTIQEAINNAADGDTVFVKSGTYIEHVVVNKTVALVGEDVNTTVIDGNYTGHVFYVVGSHVNFTAFTVQHSGSVEWPALDAGICLNGTTDCTISGNSFIDCDFASISLLNCQWNTITANHILGTGWGGIHLMNSSRNVVSGNNIADKHGGINGHVSSNYNNFTENVISECTYGGFWHASSNNNFFRNNISDIAVEGIWLQDQVNYNIVAENNLINNTVAIRVQGPNYNNTLSANFITGAEYGIKIESNARYTLIADNIIVNNHAGNDSWSAGIRLDNGGDTQIHTNVISGNHYGILLYSSSPRVTVYANNVTENDFGIRVASGGSSYFNATGNVVANNTGNGIGITGSGGASNYATISRNLIANNFDGILLGQYSNYNTIIQNNISQNGYGFYIEYSAQNTIWGNNLVSNDQQVYMYTSSVNNWNSSYPTGGNYWSDYNGSDCRNGPSQSLAGCDGFGDAPHVLDGDNIDNYPFMKPIPCDLNDIGVTCLGKVGPQGASSMKTVIAEGTMVHFCVFVMNYGNDTENFNVTTYINATLLGTQTEIPIPSRGYAIVNFTWDTSLFEKGSYAITAQVTAVPDETDTSDNSLVCLVAVGVVGDVDNSGIVNMLDVYNIALHFGALVGQTNYVPNYDIDDNAVINMLDLYFAAVHYGEIAHYWWPMFHHDRKHTGYSTSTAPNTNHTIWNYITGEAVISSPAVVNGKVYVGSCDKKIYCLDALTGAHVWNYTTGWYVYSSPAVASDKVYIGSRDGKVYCFNASTGAHIWNYTTSGDVQSSPVFADGKVYIGSSDRKIYCLDALTGAHVWNYTTGDWVRSSPAVADGKIYVGSRDGKVYCLDALTGASVWNYATGGEVWSSPAVAGGRVYVGSIDGRVYCLDALTGASVWNYATGGEVWSSPAVAGGKVYVGSFDDKIYCLDASTGIHMWNYTTGNNAGSSPAVVDGKVYVGSYDGKVYCLDALTGAHIWNYTTGDEVFSSPAVVDGKVYVGSDDGKVYAFGTSVLPVDCIGSLKATFDFTDNVYVRGEGFAADTDVTLYLLPDEEDALSSNAVANASAATASIGDLPAALLWTQPLTIGEYNVWVDVSPKKECSTREIRGTAKPSSWLVMLMGKGL